jgi:hypothetical protein
MMEKASKKGGAKKKGATVSAKTKPARVSQLQPAKKKARPSKPKQSASGAIARKVSKYEQSGAPWWKQHLPE